MKTRNFNEAPFTPFFSNGYSQNGEEGVILEILNRIGWSDLSNWVVEFGAWYGRHLSNTFSLVESKNFSAVYIEGDPDKYADLEKTVVDLPNIKPILSMVASNREDANSLDNLLTHSGIPTDFDILSIDIDTFDLDIWESLTNFKPKIVVIEINSGIMPGILSRHNSLYDGNSFSSTLQVARMKQYVLVSHTGNCIFVRNDLMSRLQIPQRYLDYPELLFRYEEMWMPSHTPLLRLLLRRLLPLKMKFFIMRGHSLFRIWLVKDKRK